MTMPLYRTGQATGRAGGLTSDWNRSTDYCCCGCSFAESVPEKGFSTASAPFLIPLPVASPARPTPRSVAFAARFSPLLVALPARSIPLPVALPARSTPLPVALPARLTPLPVALPARLTPLPVALPARSIFPAGALLLVPAAGFSVAGLSVAASSAKETKEKTPTIQSATRGNKTFFPKDRTISIIVMGTLSFLSHESGLSSGQKSLLLLRRHGAGRKMCPVVSYT